MKLRQFSSLNKVVKFLVIETMLATIDQTRNNIYIDDFLNSLVERNLTLYATDLLELRGCNNLVELGEAIRRATKVCTCMHLPLQENFKVVYRARNGEVVQDWRLSPMAYMLLAINADSSNELIAKLQVELIRKALHQE
jgi:hypothetical protein